MSKNIESYYLKQNMREDLMACYREVAPTCITQYGAWRKTVNHPAKRYYVTPKQVLQVLSAYFHGDKDIILKKKHNRRELYENLLREVKQLMSTPEHHKKSLYQICCMAVLRPAPKFFICPEYMAKIFFHVKSNHYDEDGRFTVPYPSLIRNRKNNDGTKH